MPKIKKKWQGVSNWHPLEANRVNHNQVDLNLTTHVWVMFSTSVFLITQNQCVETYLLFSVRKSQKNLNVGRPILSVLWLIYGRV